MAEAEDLQDRIARAFSRIEAVQDQVAAIDPTKGRPRWELVLDFHEGLDHLETAGWDVEEFRISPKQEKPTNRGYSLVEQQVIGSKVNAAMRYFTLSEALRQLADHIREDPAAAIGFNYPRRQSSTAAAPKTR